MFELEKFEGFDSVTIPQMGRERGQRGWLKPTGTKPKVWTGYWYQYVQTPEGEKRRERSKVIGPCSEISKTKAKALLYDIIRAQMPATSGDTFRRMAQQYLDTAKGRVSKHWYKSLEALFNNQILPRIGDRVAAELRNSEIQQAINSIAADPNCNSKSIVGKCVTHIRAVYNAAIKDQVLTYNPATHLDTPKTRQVNQRFLSIEECQRLLQVSLIASHTGRRDHMILMVMLVCALRPSELFALRRDDVKPGALRIDQTVIDYKVVDHAKTEGSLSTIPLPKELYAELLSYIEDERIVDFLFPSETGTTPISPDNYLDRQLKRLGVLAGIDVSTRYTKKGKAIKTSGLNHQILRRTAATHFQNHGPVTAAQSILRHTSATTTLKHYIKPQDQNAAECIEGWDAQLRADPNLLPSDKLQ